MMQFCQKIDIHTHMLDNERLISQRLTANKYMGFSRCVLLPVPENMSMGGPTFFAEDAYALSRRYPEHFTWMCNLCPDGTDLTHEKVKRYKQMGAVGLGEFGTRIRFDDPKMDHLFAVLEQVQMPFLFHMAPADADPYYGIVDDPRLPGLERALKKFPKLIFIGHSQPFWFEMAKTDVTDPETRNSCPFGPFVEGRVPELMRQYPNLYCDLSANSGQTALLRDPAYGLAFVKEFQDRLMFGTDWMFREDAPCHFALSAWLDFCAAKELLPFDAYQKICFGNAERLFFQPR